MFNDQPVQLFGPSAPICLRKKLKGPSTQIDRRMEAALLPLRGADSLAWRVRVSASPDPHILSIQGRRHEVTGWGVGLFPITSGARYVTVSTGSWHNPFQRPKRKRRVLGRVTLTPSLALGALITTPEIVVYLWRAHGKGCRCDRHPQPLPCVSLPEQSSTSPT